MDELISMVSQKAGITTEQAKTAVVTVMDYLKNNLPDSVSGQFDAMMGAMGGMMGSAGDAMKGGMSGAMDMAKGVTGSMGGMLGKQ